MSGLAIEGRWPSSVARRSPLDQFARAIDLAQLPHRQARIEVATVPVSSPKRSRASRSRSGSQAASARSQWVRASRKSPLKVANQGEAAAGDAGFHDPSRLLRFAQERRRQLARRPQFAAHVGPGPLTVSSRETLRKSSVVAASSAARAKAAFVSSAAKPFDHIIAWP